MPEVDDKTLRKTILDLKVVAAVEKCNRCSTVDLIILKDAIEDELIARGYYVD